MNMSKFYSSLVINFKTFTNVHQVFKPRYNKEFFKRLSANLEHLKAAIENRCHDSRFADNYDLSKIREDSSKLIKLKDQLEKIESNGSGGSNTNLECIRSQLEEIEERLMPFAVSIPNRASKHVPVEDLVLDQMESDFEESLSKMLSHRKLSYINNCYSKSVVGPNSHYYFGIGAKLQYGLSDFFITELEKHNFILTSGLCLVKSAVVEAANSRDLKDYTTDPSRVLSEDSKFTTMHLVEASRESLTAFLTSLGPIVSNNPVRLMSNGAGYRNGSDWFDSDDKSITQFETVHALTLAPSVEQYSMKEYHSTVDIIWNTYKTLKLPTRLVQCSLNSMVCNEYDARRIDIWLPSKNQWIPVSRVSHYLDYITVRTGMKRGHIIDSMVYDGQALVAAIIENNQTSTGKFIIPPVIKEHMVGLTENERSSYFREHVTNELPYPPPPPPVAPSSVLNNYEQRRYLVKRNYVLGHSQHAEKARTGYRPLKFLAAACMIVYVFIDWEEVYIQLPTPVKRFLYDKVYRVFRRGFMAVSLRGVDEEKRPEDLSFDELDTSSHQKTIFQRRKERFESMYPDRTRERDRLRDDK